MSEGPEASPPEPAAPVDPAQVAIADRRRHLFFAIWGTTGLGLALLFRAVLLPFFLAIVVAYVFEPVVAAMERRRLAGRKPPRWAAVLTLYVALLGAIGTLTAVGVPQLLHEIKGLAVELPQRLTEIRDDVVPRVERELRRALGEGSQPSAPVADRPPADGAATRDTLRVLPLASGGYEVVLPHGGLVVTDQGDRLIVTEARTAPQDDAGVGGLDRLSKELSTALRSNAGSVVDVVRGAIRGVVRPVFTFFIMLMLSAYILITKDSILEFFRVLVRPERRPSFDSLLTRIDKGLSGVVRGQLLICVVNGVLSGAGFYALGLRYWWLLTLFATVLSIIPIFGSILSSIPAVVIGLQMSPMTALLTLGWILLIHQVEANLLNPKIMGDAAKVHPVLVVFALLSGEHLFGIAGALLAVPVLSITQSVFFHYRESALGIAAPRADRTRG